MKEYDVIVVGTGSAMYVVDGMIQRNPNLKVAVIDKDEPGGICLTRGCIPSKILLYPAEVIRTIQTANKFGIDVDLKGVNFQRVMERMRTIIDRDIESIREGLSTAPNLDYYPAPAEFTAPYTMKVQDETIKAKMILLSIGSQAIIPPIKGLNETGYQTSDTILHITKLPESIAIVGGGYIAAEYGHFLSAMGSKVTIIGRNPQFLPQEEPEVSALAKKELGQRITILTNHEVLEVSMTDGMKRVVARDRGTGKEYSVLVQEIMIAAGRGPTTSILHPERAGIKTDPRGWTLTSEFLETSAPNVWAFGDANGKFLFKHKANYDTSIVYYNAVLKRKVPVDYHAVPHAVFTDPEVAGVGLREREAVEQLGEDKVLIGFERYEDTAKGEAMAVKDYFVKVILERDTLRILGAHVIGPQASVLIQEIINLMYTSDQSARPLLDAMHIHPALTEVVQRAVQAPISVAQYRHELEHASH
ncbi:MAG TPA: dihydrolipoyl dehydrogenase [Candidatus Acidoferrales bacterium]|nr:dihydrolipoyl dehydrogenase [Candidatus Acidoferrales bacterium]